MNQLTNQMGNVPAMSQLSAQLLDFIREEILFEGDMSSLTSADDLLRSDILDSLSVMRLVDFIYRVFGYSVPPEDITLSNFSSVDTICDYLSTRL